MRRSSILIDLNTMEINGVIINDLPQFHCLTGSPIKSIGDLVKSLCLAQSLSKQINYPGDPQHFIFIVEYCLLQYQDIEFEFLPYINHYSITLFIKNPPCKTSNYFIQCDAYKALKNIGIRGLYYFPLSLDKEIFTDVASCSFINGFVFEYNKINILEGDKKISIFHHKDNIILNLPKIFSSSPYFSYGTYAEKI